MDGSDHQTEESQPSPPKASQDELAVKAARFLKGAKPKLNRFIVFARPRAQAAGQEALRYVREHEGEIKQNAVKLARYRLHGPLGLVIDALTRGPAPAERPDTRCSQCGSVNLPSARFCTECGTRLAVEEPRNHSE